ncbi:RING-H2 finger protein ATL46-like [Gastrolobium bilobum]|uniref:RING-H2 finger protein ATL46-like n=1 Tax=Gastrolobium bilobum TaxID=150636 RepID=UPI002AB0B993|nr:RING-H2 finger protein ATL46-like [Gastrolobium bilobum]
MSENMYPRWFFDHTHLKMAWIQHQIQQKDGYLSYPPPVLSSSSSPYPGAGFHKEPMSSSSTTPPPSSSSTRISPAVLFIIVILAVLFFISGLLHLLVRFLMKHPSSSASAQSNRHHEISTSDALQRQLQQLFHLHDSGLDQAFIDALPVFLYKEIVGLKEPFDCAVCLCEFSEKDKLRLLPMCSHAFHISCIDTWLLSNSTCPLCRGTLLTPEFSVENPIFDFDDLREDDGCPCNVENGFTTRQKTVMVEDTVDKGVVPVRLGKFKKLNVEDVEIGVGETSSSNLDARRCYSLGSYQYVVGNSDLRVTLNHDHKDHNTRLTKETEHGEKLSLEGDMEAKKIRSVSKGDSFSVSKIWLWPKKGKFSSSLEAQIGMPSYLNTDLQGKRGTEGA